MLSAQAVGELNFFFYNISFRYNNTSKVKSFYLSLTVILDTFRNSEIYHSVDNFLLYHSCYFLLSVLTEPIYLILTLPQ